MIFFCFHRMYLITNYNKHSIRDTFNRNKITFYKKNLFYNRGKSFRIVREYNISVCLSSITLCNCLNFSLKSSLGYRYVWLYVELLNSLRKQITPFWRKSQALAEVVLRKYFSDFRAKSRKTFIAITKKVEKVLSLLPID